MVLFTYKATDGLKLKGSKTELQALASRQWAQQLSHIMQCR